MEYNKAPGVCVRECAQHFEACHAPAGRVCSGKEIPSMIAMWKRYGDLHTRDGIRIKLLLQLSLQRDEILDSHSPADGYWALGVQYVSQAALLPSQRAMG